MWVVPTRLSRTLWPSERAIARPPEQLTVSDWADRYRILPADSPVPGRWSTATAPHLRGIMDSYGDRRCRSMVLMGGTQWGKTETLINCCLYTIDQDPAPVLFVMPNEDEAVSFGHRRLKPAIDCSPRVRAHRTPWKKDWRGEEIALNGMVLYFGWAQSPTRLAARSIARLFMDEVDKYPAFAGREADPISLATERLRWWRDGKRVLSSTPLRADGYIFPLFEAGDRRHYHVPCPHCGKFQALAFSLETVKFPPGERDPERVAGLRLARYVCACCGREIDDREEVKGRMLAAGVWCPADGRVDAGGRVRANLEAASRSWHMNALYSPVLTFSDVAAEFLRSRDDPRKLMNFTNSWLGLPWIEQAEELTTDKIRARVVATPRGRAPRGTVVLVAGVDVQKHSMFWTVRAWGTGERSRTIDSGVVDKWDALGRVLLGRTFADEDGAAHEVRLACVDTGYRTDEVYSFCAQVPERLRPIKGADSLISPLRTTRIERDFEGRPGGLVLWSIDVGYFKDKLLRQMRTPLGAAGAWTLHDDPTEEYVRHACSEHKVLERSRRTHAVREVWAPRPGGGPNHLWDAEVYAQAAGEMLGVYALRDDGAAPPPVHEQQVYDEARRWRTDRDREREGFLRRRGAKRGGFVRRRGE
jgi:phage terminase large subunit GpA-like protein